MSRWKNTLKKAKKAEEILSGIDRFPLWIFGLLMVAVTFLPFFRLGKGCVSPFHDQLDETLFTYVLNGKYLGTGTEIFPELLGGINASGMQPAGVLFVPLYHFLDPFSVFFIQYAMVSATALLGMYFCVKEMTGSSILSLTAGGIFCLLPSPPVYGLSVVGVPLVFYCFLCLYRKKNLAISGLLLLYFGLASHLVLIGYVVLGFWALSLLWMLIRKKGNRWVWLGFLWLTGIYVAVNHSLFTELFLGQGSYVSHREEMVNYATPFWETVCDVFLNSAQHAESLHKHLILPILLMLILAGFGYRRMTEDRKRRFLAALAGILILAGIALFYGFCKWRSVVEFKNRQAGFLHYFQMERVYWLYPAGWILEFILCFSLWWDARPFCLRPERTESGEGKQSKLCRIAGSGIVKILVLGVLLYPTWPEWKENSYFYLNVNQLNNGSGITGYISWESYYAEDLMRQLEEAIGRNPAEYRIAHLGMSPAPALMHGFYTADGYSNNYPLAYKQQFRRVIARELEKNEETRLYFDEWGSRCYLFNGATGNTWMLGKKDHIVYEKLELDMEALKELGCEYLFSCGEIRNADELELQLIGYYETETSYWGVWLYEITAD